MNGSESMDRAERRVRAGQTVRVVIWLVLVAALVALGVVNTDKVTVDWIVDEGEAPVWLIIALSAVAGAIIGLIASVGRRH